MPSAARHGRDGPCEALWLVVTRATAGGDQASSPNDIDGLAAAKV